MRLIDWKTQFLRQRSLTAPDGRPLYAYRTTQSEFTSLESLLRDTIATQRQPLPLFRSFEFVPAFSTLYVLYSAEWWRQRYDGSGFSWEPILAGLSAHPDDWSPSQRSVCVTKGLEHWKLRPIHGTGMRFIGSIALQGGLPLQLLSRSHGNLGRLLRCVLREAVKTTVTTQEIYNWVRSLNHYLPNTYRQTEIHILLTNVIVTALCLKDEADLRQPQDAIAELDRRIVGWRDRFPLPVEDHLAQGIIEQLVQDVTKARVAHQPRTFSVERFLENVDSKVWQLCSAISLPESVRGESLSYLFGLGGTALPRFLDVSLDVCEGRQRTVSMRRLAGQDEYRIERKPWRASSAGAVSEHVLRLFASDGRVWSAVAPRGEPLDDGLLWVFDARDASPKFLRQGSGSVSTNEALVAVPQGSRPMACDRGSVVPVGKLETLQRDVFLVREEGHFQCDGAACRVLTGRAGASEEGHEWRGQRLWHTIVQPSMAFVGKPRCYRVDENGNSHAVPGEPEWRPLGGARRPNDIPVGPVEFWHGPSGEVRHRARMVVLPPGAGIRLECKDAFSGCVYLENWGIKRIVIDQEGVTASVEQSGSSFIVTLVAHANAHPPATVEALAYWPHRTKPARLQLTFPAKGVRIFAASGQELADGSRLASNQLIGVRALCLMGMHGTAPNMRLELCLPNTGQCDSFPIHAPEGYGHAEIRLQDYAQEISQLLSHNDSPDAYIEVLFRSAGRVLARIFVARYACRIQRLEQEAAIDRDALLALPVEEQLALPVMALCLNSPGEDAIRLEPRSSAGVPTGTWGFDPRVREPGPWLIYPAASSAVAFRPTLWSVEGVQHRDTGLSQAVGVEDPDERTALLDVAVSDLTADFLAKDWENVERLVTQLGHLPLATLDLWRRFSRSSRAMASLALRFSSLPYSFLERFASELTFSWELVSLADWREAMIRLKTQCETAFAAAAETVFRNQLNGRLRDLTSYHPALTILLGIARTIIDGEAPREVELFRALGVDGVMNMLYHGDDCPFQHLLRRHAEDKWPEFFCPEVSRARTALGRLLPSTGPGFQDGVVHMPALLAYRTVKGITQEWLDDRNFVLELRRNISFDPDWFDHAYTWNVAACCLAAGILDDEVPL